MASTPKNSTERKHSKPLIQKILRFLLPCQCVHCRELLWEATPLCDPCWEAVHLLDPMGRCCHCFRERDNEERPWCDACIVDPPLLQCAAAWSYEEPVSSVIHHYKYRNEPLWGEALSGYLVLQWERLGWPWPDCVTAVPLAWPRRLLRGYNQSALLAEGVARALGVPYAPLLGRKTGRYQQSSLGRQERKELAEEDFFLARPDEVRGKTILLIDDVITTGSTVNASAAALWQGKPKELFALALAMGT